MLFLQAQQQQRGGGGWEKIRNDHFSYMPPPPPNTIDSFLLPCLHPAKLQDRFQIWQHLFVAASYLKGEQVLNKKGKYKTCPS